MNIPAIPSTLPATQTLCVGCGAVISKSFNSYGSYLKGGGVVRKEVPAYEYDFETDKVIETVKEVAIPVQGYVKGWVCYDCLTWKHVTKVRRDGSTYTIPIFKPETSPTATQTLPGGVGSGPMHRVKPLEKRTQEIRGLKGKGGVSYHLVVGVHEETVDSSCYQKFGNGSKRGGKHNW